MTRSGFFTLALLAFAPVSAAHAQEEISIGLIADPGYETAGWALASGKVSDPSLEITMEFLPIPAMIQAAMTGAFDILPNGVLAIPQLNENGVDTRILGTILRYNPEGHASDLWVLPTSGIDAPTGLVGKKVAVTSIEAQNILSIRTILAEVYDMDAAAIGGDIQWVEIPQAQFEAALTSGQVDAVAFGNTMAVTAAKAGYVSVLHGAKELEDLYGGPMVSVVLSGSQAQIDQRPEAFEAALRLLRESAIYAIEHPEEVFAAVAPKYDISVEDLEVYFTENTSIPFALGPTDEAIISEAWKAGQKLGVVGTLPESVESVVWDRSIREE